ncbi:MAG: hypothetical protein ACREU5_00515 [Burkholderiales bacterium]
MFRRLCFAAALAVAIAPALAQVGTRGTGANSFNPAVSLILQGTAATSSQDPNTYHIDGFAPPGGEIGPAPRGFSLGESEISIAANVDPYFLGQMTASFTPDNELEVEEAFFQTLSIGQGFTLKGGRFLSAIGYENSIHQHAWDFQDAPLAYQAFLGGRWNDDGVQLKWLAPTDLFLELGGELGNGRNFPGTPNNRNGSNAGSVFAHVGGDLSDGTAWRGGLSMLRATPQDRAFDAEDASGNPVTQSFSGTSKLYIADFILKWAPHGDDTVNNFKLQGEYFYRDEGGALTYDAGAPVTGDYASRQSGWYLQGVYQWMPQWRAGLRYDQLDRGTVDSAVPLAGPLATDYSPSRVTAMVDWTGTEFSRIRLQVAEDKSRQGMTDHQVVLQYIFSLGAHGAHTF